MFGRLFCFSASCIWTGPGAVTGVTAYRTGAVHHPAETAGVIYLELRYIINWFLMAINFRNALSEFSFRKVAFGDFLIPIYESSCGL